MWRVAARGRVACRPEGTRVKVVGLAGLAVFDEVTDVLSLLKFAEAEGAEKSRCLHFWRRQLPRRRCHDQPHIRQIDGS